MSGDVWACVASGEPKMKTMRKIMYEFFVRMVNKKRGEGLDIYWRDNVR